MSAPSLWSEQTKIVTPTLFVHGENDPCFRFDHAVEAAKQIRARISGSTRRWATSCTASNGPNSRDEFTGLQSELT